jgi:hypothetical protein
MTETIYKFLIPFLMAVLLASSALASCGQTGASLSVTATDPVTTTTGQQAQVTLIYFFKPVGSPGEHLATEWIVSTIETDYQSFIEEGKLAFNGSNTDNPAGAQLAAEYAARTPSVFLSVSADGTVETSELKALWMYLDESLADANLEAAFKSMLEKELDTALGLREADPEPTDIPGQDVLSSVDFHMSGALLPEGLDLAILPLDEDGRLVRIDGLVRVSVWAKPDFFSDVRGELLQEWSGVLIKASDSIDGVGVMLNLAYRDFRPASGQNAFVQVTLEAGGYTFSSCVKNVMIRRPLACCEIE